MSGEESGVNTVMEAGEEAAAEEGGARRLPSYRNPDEVPERAELVRLLASVRADAAWATAQETALKESWGALLLEAEENEAKLRRLQGVAQIVADILRVLGPQKYVVRASNGARYMVGVRGQLLRRSAKLQVGARVTLDISTLVIMRVLPKEVDPLVHKMSVEDPGDVSYAQIGGLEAEIRLLREVVEMPLTNPEMFARVGVSPPKGVLLYGPPGTGKTLLARAVASQLSFNFLKVVSSSVVDKYIGESARIIREMFTYARDHEPCIIFMDEVDAIAGRRYADGNSSDREIQRTLMELLAQMDGFSQLGRVKVIMATNRPDTLDPAILRPGRLDRKIEIPLPNSEARVDILGIHIAPIRQSGPVDLEPVAALADGFCSADLRNVCTEAGLLALRHHRTAVHQEDLMRAVRKVADTKKLESKLDYRPV